MYRIRLIQRKLIFGIWLASKYSLYKYVTPSVIMLCISVGNLYSGIGKVNYNTGQLSWSTDLVTLKSHSLSYPVKLRYNSGIRRGHIKGETGINPERASWVGTGFEIETPYIERIVRGAPDNATGHTKFYGYNSVEQLNALRTQIAPNADTKGCIPDFL